MARRPRKDRPSTDSVSEIVVFPERAGNETTEIDDDDLQYVYPLPKGLDTNCPVCFSALYTDPYVNVTCGHHICGACAARIHECPNCRSELDLSPDLGLQRMLKSLVVYCNKKEQGCQWEGELGELERHHKDEEKGCLYVETKCPHNSCNVRGLRHELLTHKEMECPFRPVTCKHCKTQFSRKIIISGEHYGRCSLYPLTCMACGTATVRKDMEKHVKEVCPKTVVSCDISRYGCKWKGPRDELEQHMKEEWSQHFHLGMQSSFESTKIMLEEKLQDYEDRLNKMETMYKVGFKKMEATIDEKNEVIKALQRKITKLEDTTQRQISLVKLEVKEMEEKITDKMEQSFIQLREDTEQESSIDYESSDEDDYSFPITTVKQKATFVYTLINFRKSKYAGKACYSEPFYTSNPGYRMQLRVHPNGYGKGKGTHISVYVCLLKGNSDELLNWPFLGTVIVTLQNGSNQFMKAIHYNYDTPSDFGMITKQSSKGNGCPHFLHRRKVEQYIINDTLDFYVIVNITT